MQKLRRSIPKPDQDKRNHAIPMFEKVLSGLQPVWAAQHPTVWVRQTTRWRTQLRKMQQAIQSRTNQRRFRVKQAAVVYLGGKCQVCSYDKCLAALVFHHRDSSSKLFSIGGAHSRSWKSIKLELDKCDLLCANAIWSGIGMSRTLIHKDRSVPFCSY